MQKQTKSANKGITHLLCTYKNCKEPQGETEYCDKHINEMLDEQEEFTDKHIVANVIMDNKQ